MYSTEDLKGGSVLSYLWTIQKKSVLDIINSKGVYYPTFRYDKRDCVQAYRIVLDSFNRINKGNYEGLVFCFAKEGESKYFESVDEVYKYFMDNPLVTDAFNLWDDEHVILELKYSDSFNLIPIDFNDFIQIMPPVYDRNAYNVICSRIKEGIYLGGYTLPSFTQIHVPFIKRENIVNIYGNFDKLNSSQTGILTTFSLE